MGAEVKLARVQWLSIGAVNPQCSGESGMDMTLIQNELSETLFPLFSFFISFLQVFQESQKTPTFWIEDVFGEFHSNFYPSATTSF